MTFSNVLGTVTAVTLVVGVVFGMIQLRQFRRARQLENALEFLRSFQSPQMGAALRLVFDLPPGLSGKETEEALAEHMDLVYSLIGTWESIGVLVFRSEVELDLVDDFFSGPIRVSWEKLEPLVTRVRETSGRETIAEWFEWLADRLAEREAGESPVPAQVAHRDWRPGKR